VREVAGDQLDEAARGEETITQHVPGGRPHERARHRIDEAGEVGRRGRERTVVERDAREREVIVVEQQQVTRAHALELRDVGRRALDVELDALAPDEAAAVEVVDADGEPVAPQHRGVALGAPQRRRVRLLDADAAA
jgi:hypothetical protein